MMPQAATAEHRAGMASTPAERPHHERHPIGPLVERARGGNEGVRAAARRGGGSGACERVRRARVGGGERAQLSAAKGAGAGQVAPEAAQGGRGKGRRVTILEAGTRVEIFGEEERWWPATIMERTEDTDGRLHRVQYTNFESDRSWHVLDDERWRRVAEGAPSGTGT